MSPKTPPYNFLNIQSKWTNFNNFWCKVCWENFTRRVTNLSISPVKISLSKCASCYQQRHAGSKTSVQENPPILNSGCQLMQDVPNNGCKEVIVVVYSSSHSWPMHQNLSPIPKPNEYQPYQPREKLSDTYTAGQPCCSSSHVSRSSIQPSPGKKSDLCSNSMQHKQPPYLHDLDHKQQSINKYTLCLKKTRH